MARRAHSLTTLLNQVNAAHPNRNKASDGWIGDAAHAARVSDHNPDANGVVRAIDITHDMAHGVDIGALFNNLIGDNRIKYLIWNRRIWTPSGGWKSYTGSNPHTVHGHISVGGNYDDGRNWSITIITPSPTPPPSGTVDPMNTPTGHELYLTALFRPAESDSAASQWNPRPARDALIILRNQPEWQANAAKIKNYDTLMARIVQMEKDGETSKGALAAAQEDAKKAHEKVLALEKKAAEQPVVIPKPTPAPPKPKFSWKEFFSNLLRRK